MPTPQQHLDIFLKRYDATIDRQARDALRYLRRRLQGSVEMIYDNYNALVVGFGPTAKPSQAILSVGVYPRWVNLYLLQGARLMDPGKVLQGNGKLVRFIRLSSDFDLSEPEIDALIEQSIENANPPFNPKQKRQQIVKSISTRQRSRRPSGKK